MTLVDGFVGIVKPFRIALVALLLVVVGCANSDGDTRLETGAGQQQDEQGQDLLEEPPEFEQPVPGPEVDGAPAPLPELREIEGRTCWAPTMVAGVIVDDSHEIDNSHANTSPDALGYVEIGHLRSGTSFWAVTTEVEITDNSGAGPRFTWDLSGAELLKGPEYSRAAEEPTTALGSDVVAALVDAGYTNLLVGLGSDGYVTRAVFVPTEAAPHWQLVAPCGPHESGFSEDFINLMGHARVAGLDVDSPGAFDELLLTLHGADGVDGVSRPVAEVETVLQDQILRNEELHPPPPPTAWIDLDPDRRVIWDAPPEIRAELESYELWLSIPPKWRQNNELLLCTKTTFGWNDCSVLDPSAGQNDFLVLEGFRQPGESVELLVRRDDPLDPTYVIFGSVKNEQLNEAFELNVALESTESDITALLDGERPELIISAR